MEISVTPEMVTKVRVAVCDSCRSETDCNCVPATQPQDIFLLLSLFDPSLFRGESDAV